MLLIYTGNWLIILIELIELVDVQVGDFMGILQRKVYMCVTEIEV